MINKLIRIMGLAALAGPAFAQAPVGSTTLSGAISSFATTACLASATGVVVPNLATGVLGSIFVIDSESMQVMAAGPTSTCFNVKRGAYANSESNAATAHGNGQKVWVLGPTLSTGDPSRPISASAFLSQRPYQPFYVASTPSLFGVAPASTAATAGKIYFSALEVDFNMLATGACVLNGATPAGNVIVALYDMTGTLVANSTTAGTAAGTLNQYQCIAFTSPVALLGPNQYFLAAQASSTNTFDLYAAGAAHSSFPTASQTGVFGTLAPLNPVPTTFTALAGPLMTLY